MSSFLSSLANKAQTAIEQSPLAGQYSHLQAKFHGSAEHAGSGKSSGALDTINYQFRNLQMQLSSSVDPVQRIITAEKGVALDFESVAKDTKSQSKEIYTWGKEEDHLDIRDVTDRLGYLNYMFGELSGALSDKLDAARASLKKLRNAERAIEPKRNVRLGLYNQIARIEHDQKGSRSTDRLLADLKEQLRKAEVHDEQDEREIAILKRKALAESERAKWMALREYGEKIILLAEASDSFIAALPSLPPSEERPYTGAKDTATARASLQHALDNYKPGTLVHQFQPSVADLERSDSRSFGVTHETELSSIRSSSLSSTDATAAAAAATPVLAQKQQQQSQTEPEPEPEFEPTHTVKNVPSLSQPTTLTAGQSPPVNPANLNTSPTPIPAPNTITSRVFAPDAPPPVGIPEPTIAETGKPLSAGAGGPGPASGSISQLKAERSSGKTPESASGQAVPAPTAAAASVSEGGKSETVPKYAEGYSGPKEKKGVGYETAKEEKERLEREEAERLRKKESAEGENSNIGDDGTPPPYEEFGGST